MEPQCSFPYSQKPSTSSYLKQMNLSEISGSHGYKYEDSCPWDIASCNLVDTGRRSRGTYCLHRQGHRPLKYLSISTRIRDSRSEKPEDSHLQMNSIHFISLIHTLILSFHLRIGLPSGLLLSGFQTKILYAFLTPTLDELCHGRMEEVAQ
jgi:hypothetical protein